MSVLIKGMDMPKCAVNGNRVPAYVTINIWADGHVYIFGENPMMLHDAAVELPDHGDLVDRDELMMKMWEASAYAPNHCSWVNARVVFAKDIEDAPVVIPAERSEDEAD